MYEPENLFPDAPGHREGLRQYVAERMVELAADGRLYLTDVMNQPRHIAQAAGMVLLGQDWQEMENADLGRGYNPQPGAEVPVDLAGFKVRLKCINRAADDKEFSGHNKICWRDGVEAYGVRRGRGSTSMGLSGNDPVKLFRAVEKQVDGPEAELPVRAAWLALKQAGANCCYARRPDHQHSRWLVAEVRPKVRHGRK